MPEIMKPVIRTMAAALVVVPALFLLYVYLTQERVLFYPVRLARETRAFIRDHVPEAEELTLAAQDGVTLHGWLLRARSPGPSPLLIYFGGNAEEVSGMIPEARRHLAGWSVALVNYRGYGLSGGRPGEKALTADAELVYDTLTARGDVGAGGVALMGRSLGTAVAVRLASARPVRGVVLISPFESMTEVAKVHFPHLPVSLLLKHRFECASLAPSIMVPALALVAAEDRIVPPGHSYRLMERWGGEHHVVTVPGAGHNTLGASPRDWDAIKRFLDGLKETGTVSGG
jgi:pimeloyl-ACP methyl ester carboxylesterase